MPRFLMPTCALLLTPALGLPLAAYADDPQHAQFRIGLSVPTCTTYVATGVTSCTPTRYPGMMEEVNLRLDPVGEAGSRWTGQLRRTVEANGIKYEAQIVVTRSAFPSGKIATRSSLSINSSSRPGKLGMLSFDLSPENIPPLEWEGESVEQTTAEQKQVFASHLFLNFGN
jgi:hypothetical protein